MSKPIKRPDHLQDWISAGKPWPWSTLHRPLPGDPIDRMLDDLLELDLIDTTEREEG